MYILIAEDEPLTAQRLKKMVAEILGSTTRFTVVDTVVEVAELLQVKPLPDLLLLDIHLADGSSLDIFNLIEVETPVIFTTAYDEHAVKAFRVNAVDYLLKPIKKQELALALKKWQALPAASIDYQQLASALRKEQSATRFLLRSGQQMHLIAATDAAYFQTEDGLTLLTTFKGKRLVMDQSLDSLESELNEQLFFRVNRQFIINRDAINELHAYSKSRVKLMLNPKLETIVSTERSPHFKEWLVSGN